MMVGAVVITPLIFARDATKKTGKTISHQGGDSKMNPKRTWR